MGISLLIWTVDRVNSLSVELKGHWSGPGSGLWPCCQGKPTCKTDTEEHPGDLGTNRVGSCKE